LIVEHCNGERDHVHCRRNINIDRFIAEWSRQQAAPNAERVAKRHTLMAFMRHALIVASLLFAVALVGADGPIRVTAVLPGVPALLAVGLGDGERAVS
jgi:hypothetical protein